MGAGLKKGLFQVYTGDGKGKTTASLGLAIRAVGQGFAVLIVQLLKSPDLSSGERNSLKKLEPDLVLRRLDTPWWSLGSFKKRDHVERMQKNVESELVRLQKSLKKEEVDLLILDEMNVCLFYKIVEPKRFISFLDELPPAIEVVSTGRYAPEMILERADLVTEMKMVKHPYQEGIGSRRGIEF